MTAKPWIYRDIKVSDDLKAKVVEWLRNPHPCDKKEWNEIREPLLQICMNLVDLALRNGDTHMRAVLEELIAKDRPCVWNGENELNERRTKSRRQEGEKA